MLVYHFLRLALVAFLSPAFSFPLDSRDTSLPVTGADVEKREAIKAAFLYNYNEYVKYAYPADCIDLRELKGSNDPATADFGGTPIESLSSFILMNLTNTDNYKNAVKVVHDQAFYTTNSSIVDGQPGTVKLFELTIRIMGGLLSAYQMNGERAEESYFINKTKTLADRIKGSWFKGAKIPVSVWNMRDQSVFNLQEDTNIAEAGTLTMEWGTLSQYTKDDQYRSLAEGSSDAIMGLYSYFPGLPFTRVDPRNLTTDSQYITLGGGFDSGGLEYFLKYPVLLGQRDHRYIKQWTKAVESIQSHLIFKTGVNNFTFVADFDANRTTPVYLSSHLACFIGGNIAMGGRLLGRDDFTTLGLELTESCAATYDQTALGLGPYGFGYGDKQGNFDGWKFVSTQQRSFYQKHGIFVTVGYWFVAPEILESIFYAWRITGQQFWRDVAWKIFETIKKVADTGHGYAIITNVNDESTGIQGPQPPFLYSETLKYLYLIFDDSEHYSLDKIVFNTEAMAFNRANPKAFNKVQGTFPYSPLFYGKSNNSTDYRNMFSASKVSAVNTESDAASSKVLADPGPRPAGLYDAQAGSGKDDFAKQLMSYTNMPKQVAMDYLSSLKH